jgi:hypothetical protein
MNIYTRRLSRLSAATAVSALVTSGLLLAAPAAQAATIVVVSGDKVDTSLTRAKGHNDFLANSSGVHVHTDEATSLGKAAGYFDVNEPLADVGEPVMNWVPANPSVSDNRPGIQLRVDFDGDGSVDGTLVGEPVDGTGAALYGNDWWVSDDGLGHAPDAFVTAGAPSDDPGGVGGTYHGTLASWRANFPNAQVITSGWSLGSGIQGDGTITSMQLGQTKYFFTSAVAATSTTVYRSQVDQQYTRAKGHNDFLPAGGVHIYTEPSDGTDVNPGGGTWYANKAAGYFDTNIPLSDSGAVSDLNFDLTSGFIPGLQMVTDFDGDGVADGQLVGEALYPDIYWLSANTLNNTPVAGWLRFAAPRQHTEPGIPSYSAGGGSPAEWRAAFPDAKILQVGWTLGSNAVGDGILNDISVGQTKFVFAGNRAPVASDLTASMESGATVHVTLAATDADGDTLSYSSTEPDVTVAGNQLTYTAPAVFDGQKVLTYKATDPDGEFDTGTVTLTITQANRAPVASNLAASTPAGTSVQVTLAASDPDGDTLTYTSTDGTVAGNKLTYAAPADFAGAKVLAYKVTDSKGASTNGTVTVTVTKASSATSLKVSPGMITTKSKHIRGKVAVTSTGKVVGGTVDLFDGDTKIGTGVLDASGNVKIAVTKKLSKGKHKITAVFAGTGSTASSQATVVVRVKKPTK